jgi:hypothetical protein
MCLFSDIFKMDPDYQATEDKYKVLKKDLLGEGSSDEETGSGSGSSESGSESEDGSEDGKFWSSLRKHFMNIWDFFLS